MTLDDDGAILASIVAAQAARATPTRWGVPIHLSDNKLLAQR